METASTPKNPTLSERFDSLIKSAGLIVGIVSAVITIYVALTTYEINQRIGKAQADNVERDRTIKDALIEREQHENASRLVHEFGATNAKGFALGYLQEKTKYEWLDLQLRSNIESYVELWKQGRHLMTGSREDGILLRQVAWIRIANIGKRTADNVRISALVRDSAMKRARLL
jgi:hypothetical protein